MIATSIRHDGSGLIYLMGPSGSGKDALLGRARQQLEDEYGLLFAHRYITRPADAGGENHIALTEPEFARREDVGCFALTWTSHGLHYGIGRELDLWLGAGQVVVMNGSRAHLPLARRRYPALLPVLIHVRREVLRHRLTERAREAGEALEYRLARADLHPGAVPGLVTIDNSDTLESAADTLVGVIRNRRVAMERFSAVAR